MPNKTPPDGSNPLHSLTNDSGVSTLLSALHAETLGGSAVQVDPNTPKTLPPRATVERLAYTIDEACEATTLGRSKLLELIYAGTLRSLCVGRRRLVPADALREFIEGDHAAAA